MSQRRPIYTDNVAQHRKLLTTLFSSWELRRHNSLLLLWTPLFFSGMEARHETIFQINASNLIKLGKGKIGGPFRTSHECKLLTGSPTTNKPHCHWWVAYPRAASYGMLGEQLHNSYPVKHG